MSKSIALEPRNTDAVLNICLDTLHKKKQAIVFCNTKRGAESQAEKLATKVKDIVLEELSQQALNALSTPTKQCKRLATCVRKGVAFHHAGLHTKQRALVEESFRKGTIKVICSTPTLAIGLDLPAFRVIIRDLKRFGQGSWGMTDIPVLEYHQMAGRAGRPGKEDYGEAIILATTLEEEGERLAQYIKGKPEAIYSKLAVEPVLRTYVLSLIAGNFVKTRQQLHDFFDTTFYAHQYGDTAKLHSILDAMAQKLEDWEFLSSTGEDFVSAAEFSNDSLQATPLGKRVAELYLDPYTAHFLITCMKKATTKQLTDFSIIHMLCSCLELRPLLRPRTRELEDIMEKTNKYLDTLLAPEPVQYSAEYEEFLMTLKTALFLQSWIEETHEDRLLEIYGATPGELHAKRERADWLVYAAEELARMIDLKELKPILGKMRIRLQHGAKEELLPLLKLKGIGRIRARKLFNNRIRSLQEVKTAEASTMAALIGAKTTADLKKQMGIEISHEKLAVPPRKRKGQRSMADFT